jgi:hypothetical protein
MIGNGDQFILAAGDEQPFVVPVAADDTLGMLAHGGDFSLVLFEIEVEVALLVSAGEDGVGRGPL